MLKRELFEFLTEKQKKYDYSLMPEKFTYGDRLSVICHCKDDLGNEHGVFKTTISHLKRGDGCPKCNGKYMTKDLFILSAKKIHGETNYCYDNFEYINKRTKGIIHCNKHNIDFEQTPQKHLQGQGCPICRYEKSAFSKTRTTEWFIEKAKEIHGEKYDYSKSAYSKSYEKIEIICHEKDEFGKEHGSFWLTSENHLHKTYPQGCPKCARKRTYNAHVYSLQDFIERSKEVHGDKYDYSKVKYINSKTKVCIICPKHGEFWMKADNHLYGQGCPHCANIISKSENEIYNFCCDIFGKNKVKQRARDILSDNKELDIFIPSKNIAIEFDGLRWHCEKFICDKNYHLRKTQECENLGIRLIHIFEDEWLQHKEIVKSMLKDIFGVTKHKILAKKCIINIVSPKEAKVFLDENNLQGRCNSNCHYGLYYDEKLVQLISFRRRKNCYEVIRLCNKLDSTVIGGTNKLLKKFISDINPQEIIVHIDKRWLSVDLYENLGFVHMCDNNPNYFYTHNQKRENRFKYRKSELIKQGFDKEKTEHEIMLERGIYRIYDCGTTALKWIKKQ